MIMKCQGVIEYMKIKKVNRASPYEIENIKKKKKLEIKKKIKKKKKKKEKKKKKKKQ